MERNINSRFSESNSSRSSYRSGSEACSTRLSSRLNTASSLSVESPFTCSHSKNILVGEKVQQSPVRSLSSLYRPSFKQFPSFPSIYETKYQRDFQYIPFPVSKSYKQSATAPSSFRGFKFGCTTNEATFTKHQYGVKPPPYIYSMHARHKPQAKHILGQNFPKQCRWGSHGRNNIQEYSNQKTANKAQFNFQERGYYDRSNNHVIL